MFYYKGTKQLYKRTKQRVFFTYQSALFQPQSPAGQAPQGWCHWSSSPHTPSGAPCTTHQPQDLRKCPRGACEPSARSPLEAALPATQTWFTSKGLGGVIIEINPYGMFLGALGQSSYVLHIIEFCHLENGQSQVWSHSPNGASNQQPPTKGRHRKEDEHSLTVSSKLRLTPVWSLTQSKEG